MQGNRFRNKRLVRNNAFCDIMQSSERVRKCEKYKIYMKMLEHAIFCLGFVPF